VLAAIAKAVLLDQWVTLNHWSGTCNFGTVIDSNFNVIGTQRLKVVDNSVYPFPETGNTEWSAFMAAVVALLSMGVTIQFPS